MFAIVVFGERGGGLLSEREATATVSVSPGECSPVIKDRLRPTN